MPTEIIESKEIYRGFIALRLATLRLADGARVSREIIEHGKAAVALPNDARRGGGGQAPVLGRHCERIAYPGHGLNRRGCRSSER
jgi:hypothetical protein